MLQSVIFAILSKASRSCTGYLNFGLFSKLRRTRNHNCNGSINVYRTFPHSASWKLSTLHHDHTCRNRIRRRHDQNKIAGATCTGRKIHIIGCIGGKGPTPQDICSEACDFPGRYKMLSDIQIPLSSRAALKLTPTVAEAMA